MSNPGTGTPNRLRAYLFARTHSLTVRPYLGLFAGLLRAAVAAGSCMRLNWWARRHGFDLVASRLRGIADYFWAITARLRPDTSTTNRMART